MLAPLFTRLSRSCLSFKKCLTVSSHYHHHLFSTKTTANGNNSGSTITSATPFYPTGEQVRSRRLWTQEEDDLLKKLYAQHGPKYTLISRHLPGRIVSSVFRRCKYFFDPQYRMAHRPWKKEELAALRTLVDEHQATGTINWEAIQYRLPYPRALSHIKLTWYHSINTQWQQGRWTQQESRRFEQLIQQHGTTDWKEISRLLQTRSPRQCLEKYRHAIAPSRKGRFTPQEDTDLMAAVNTYGDANFLHIKQVLESPRTPRQLAKRYRYALDPAYDRSQWTASEKHDLYRLTLEYDRNMLKVRDRMNSKRHVSDMWNHFRVIYNTKVKAKNKNTLSGQHTKKTMQSDTNVEQGLE